MSKGQKRVLMISTGLMSIVPLLYLYNQNKQFLSFTQIIIWCIVLATISIAHFYLFQAAFRSYTTAFFSCLVFVVLVFFFSSTNDKVSFTITKLIFLLPFLIAYILGYLIYRIFGKFELNKVPSLALVAFGMLFLMNVFPLFSSDQSDANINKTKYKTSFASRSDAFKPNVYWLFCDGMLGFDVMEKYFGDDQAAFISKLEDRGFAINKSAKFESGHWTRISIPVLMCPDYYDANLSEIMKNHDQAVSLREKSGVGLDTARKYNETEMAFDARGYTTATISVSGPFFYPTADYYYYIKARCWTNGDYQSEAELVANIEQNRRAVDDSRMCAYQLGEIFLGGIPGQLYDLIFPNRAEKEIEMATSFDGVAEVLCETRDAKINTALVTSLYDTLYSPMVQMPKFVIVHDFLAHFPFDNDENGNMSEHPTDITSYRAHHTYAAKVLINLVDMILKADPEAVIIVQGDHGLHEMTREQITNAFGADAETDIWNSVISAIRVPAAFQNGDEKFALSNPLNISRYIVNNFVGQNYRYLED